MNEIHKKVLYTPESCVFYFTFTKVNLILQKKTIFRGAHKTMRCVKKHRINHAGLRHNRFILGWFGLFYHCYDFFLT